MSVEPDGLQARLRSLFLDELDEHVLVLNRGLVALEQGVTGTGTGELVNELFRSAHSLKGAAQAAAVEPVTAICHGLESALAYLRDQGPEADIPALQPLFQAVDALATAGRRMREDGDVSELPVARIVRALSAAGGNGGGGQRREGLDAVPVRAQPPVAGPEPVPAEVVATPAPHAPTQAAARVPAARLEALLSGSGEILLACEAVCAAVAGSTSPEAVSAVRVLASAQRALTDAVRQAGVVPFADACAGLDRVVRDVARATGRQVRLAVVGGDVELDRPILESLRDPLLHLVRNAVDHGIEPPTARASVGKDPTGSLTVAASVEGDRVAVTVSDDGSGIDVDAVRAAAARRGVGPVGPETDVLGDLVFAPGVSTAPLLTEVSGRGVGLDAVRAVVEALGGSVALASTPGAGTRVAMLVPVTRSVMRVLLVTAGGATFALPTSGVGRIVRARPQDLRSTAGRTVLCVDGHLLPVAWLSDAVGFGRGPELASLVDGVVVDAAGAEAVLVVDGVVAEQEAVIKPPPARLAGLAGVLGATILPGGRVVVVVNPATVVRLALERARPPVVGATEVPARTRRVLLVDDTLTTRTLERSILETAGYEVVAAVDGLHALDLLHSHDELGFDVVVSDVNMPRMDGLGLCAAVRSSDRFARLPVVLVTSLASEEDRRRGVQAGADAYIAKSEFDQSMLLDTLARLL